MCIKTTFAFRNVKARGVPKIIFFNNSMYLFEIIKIYNFNFSKRTLKEITFLGYNRLH